MPSIRPNAIRIKSFRELKEALRMNRDRLFVRIDIAKAQHVIQVWLAQMRTPSSPAILRRQRGAPS